MSAPITIPHEACVLVCDGRKALFLENRGDAVSPDLHLGQVLELEENPPTRDQGSDRPGRVTSGSHRSAVDQEDFHRAAAEAFALKVGRQLEEHHRARPSRRIILVAPPRTLAILRDEMSAELRASLTAEIAKDLTKLSAAEIARHLTGG